MKVVGGKAAVPGELPRQDMPPHFRAVSLVIALVPKESELPSSTIMAFIVRGWFTTRNYTILWRLVKAAVAYH